VAKQYTVKQGDYLAKIARNFGFTDYMTLWEASENATLREKRKSPNVLFPGDVVTIPDRNAKLEPANTEARHVFRVRKKPLKLRLVIQEEDRAEAAEEEVALSIEGRTETARTRKDGLLERGVEPEVAVARLTFLRLEGPFDPARPLDLRIGGLDPVDKISGQVQRLRNLGYFDATDDPMDGLELRSAVEEFQCDHQLTVDGKCGPQTQAKLLEAHGS
jgi:hypothetical protein